MKKFKPQPGFAVLAHKLALDPNATAERRLYSHAGGARAAYNWAVAYVTAVWWQRKAEQSYGIPEEELTAWRSWSLPSLRKAFNEDKRTSPRFAGWWEGNSKEAYNTGLANASAAFDNYAKSKSGRRKGRTMGVPRFKSKRKARLACRFTTGTICIEPDGHHVTLPRIGRVRLHEHRADLRALADAGNMRILSATVRLDRGRWCVSLQVEEKHELVKVARPDAAVGIDLGVKTLAVYADSDGALGDEPNPRHLDRAQRQLRRASRIVSRRQGPDRCTGQRPSRRWEKANQSRNKVHHRVANLREDTLHKLTTRLASEYGTIVVEDLNVAGMGRNRRLSRRIADAAFGEIRRQLTYKTRRHGTRLVVADRWFPSSKTCSRCGVVKAKLPLSTRVFECDTCGLVLDRDANAGHNLVALAARTTGSGVAGDLDNAPVAESKPRGADRKTRTTRPRRKAQAGRAGGTIHSPRAGKETGDRQQATRTQLALW
ncbi:IS607 family element RNA-guided endonuclease TnpB [Streptomyces scopuliridis]|uniref:IS607 family element RNA-guided endonuclease TnpB n=1 Tax=Streptomyces scopuliridis TaxID=452529 RepID=A0ACD4ZR52_9ACTN|nr:IS607 family element RNA-guided endonuclease TnpB [Streptomyces scopuliridis]WSC00459.1 IS607 family element RNA-guided endonuclease TnpB [Streptomyces scopuliridis]WSC05929.1 IS607 family element RNA-guided endonuclease TnpB [Streptomyces scopuliridis]